MTGIPPPSREEHPCPPDGQNYIILIIADFRAQLYGFWASFLSFSPHLCLQTVNARPTTGHLNIGIMTNEEEQITLNIDLYDNIMTEKEGDYTGRPRITGTLYNKQIAARIVKAGTEYKQESIEYILDRADKAKVEAIAEGKSVIDGVGQYLVTARGSFNR